MKNEMKYILKHLYHILLILLFLSLFFKCTASALDDVRLGKVGEWNNNYGEFRAVKLREIGGVNYAFCATSKGMAIFKIHYENSNQNRDKVVSLVKPFIPIGDCSDIEIEEKEGFEHNIYAYITAEYEGGYRLYIRDITNPAFSYYIGSCDIPHDIPYNKAYGVALSGGYAYVAAGKSGLHVIDISDPTKPAKVGDRDTPGIASGIAVSGSYAYVADEKKGLQVIDISNPYAPEIVGDCGTSGWAAVKVDWALGVTVSGDYAYCATKVVTIDYCMIGSCSYTEIGGNLLVIDISNPNDPVIVGRCNTPDPAVGVDVSGDYACCLTRRRITSGLLPSYNYLIGCEDRYGSLQVINISDPNKPLIVGSCDTPDDARGIAISEDQYAYVAASESGLQVIDISDPNGLKIVGSCATPDKAKVVTASGDYAYVVDGGGGLQTIDINNPGAPVIVGRCDTPEDARGIAISNNYAYVVSGENGLQVIDISAPNVPEVVGSFDTPGAANGVTISNGYAYVAAGKSGPQLCGLQVIDISNPNAPSIVGSLYTPSAAKGIAISSGYAYVAVFEKGLLVVDIGDPNTPKFVKRCDIPGYYAYEVAVSGDYAYVTCDSTLLPSCGKDYLLAIDISDPTKPSIVGTCGLPSDLLGIAVSSNYAYVANGERGLQVIDTNNPAKPAVAGSCNTPGYASGVALSGNHYYAYLADGEKGLQVIDIRDPNGPEIVGSSFAPDYVVGVAVSGDYAYLANYGKGLQVIDINDLNGLTPKGSRDLNGHAIEVAVSESYAYVATGERGLHVIDISNPNVPVTVGICDNSGYAYGVAVSGYYAYVADGEYGLQVIDISDPNDLEIVGSRDTPGVAIGVAISEDYAYVADGKYGLQVIDISDPNYLEIVGSRDTPGAANGVAISGDYAYVADGEYGLQVIYIGDPNKPVIVGSHDTDLALGVTISKGYAYVADFESGLHVIDIHDPNAPVIVETYNTPGNAGGVAISGGYAYVADRMGGLLQLKINIGPPPEGKGNLILVAGGNINYRALATQTTNTFIQKRAKTLDHKDPEASYWQITQSLANHVFHTFLKGGYEVYETYYFNPDPLQDIDNDCIHNQLIVDDFTPTSNELQDIIRQFPPEDHIANPGPLYICLIGHAAEDRFLIMANEVITAQDLKEAISEFQETTHRQVVVIIESAASGTFINDLAGPDITVITSTDDGTSYIKPDFSDPNNIPYNSFTKAFIDKLAPNLDPNNIPEGSSETLNTRINTLLKDAFIDARDQLREWAFEGLFFADQAPQMSLPEATFTSLTFSKDGVTPLTDLEITSDQDMNYALTIIGHKSDTSPIHISKVCTFFSSDPKILDPKLYEDIQTLCYYIYPGILKCIYIITPKKNGIVSLIAHPANTNDPHYLLSARITIEVSIDDSKYFKDLEKMAIIVAGYQGTGDYLWESTNTIANHAYRTLRSMGYTKQEIFYYNPYLLQDPIENRGCDDIEECNDIDGYPKWEIFDPNTDPNSSYSAFARVSNPNTLIKELFLFLIDHGTKGTFRLNPTSYLDADYLINQLENIEENVSDKIIFLYDACYSGSFLDEIKNRIDKSPNSSLSEKLITITSTDPNQLAYFLNQGIISFSYPFFDEWYLTHSLNKAFEYASATSLEGQTPEIYDPNIAWGWDLEHIYYIDEARPLIDNVQAYRAGGYLHLSADVFSLTGIDPNQVWAIIESAKVSSYGSAVTQAPEFNLSFEDQPYSLYGGRYEISVPDPCPSEATYNINVYAKDKSGRTASYKTGIEDDQVQNIKALIIATDSNLIDSNEREKFTSQVKRAEMILQSKMPEGQIKKITNLASLEEEVDFKSDHQTLNEQTLFIYLFGKVDIEENPNIFILNAYEGITPEYLYSILPWDTNQRVLILMDTPRSSQFLSSCSPDNWHENWAGIASTDQDELFFYIYGESGGEIFPCFSNFFFSMVLSGATVAQAYRMAKNAVSLTQQHPDLFPRQKMESEYAINHYLNYYLGSSAIYGEDYPLISGCTAKVEEGKIRLSLMAHPDIDPNFNAWAILKSSPSFIGQKTMIVDLQHDSENNLHYIPDQDIPGDFPYCRALFIAEGRRVSDESSKTEWKDVPIVAPESEIREDGFESDDDPNLVMSHARNEILVNYLPSRHTFYCEHNPQNGQCNDTDWIYFYAWKGILYEIYAQDLSEYGYFTKLTLYDPETSPNDPNAKHSYGTNYLSFVCKKSGYHRLKATLASSYPSGGTEYILAVCSPQAGQFTTMLLEVINPKVQEASYLRSNLTFTFNDQYISPEPWFIIDDTFQYLFFNIKPHNEIIIKVYQVNEAHEKHFLCEKEIRPQPNTTNLLKFNLKDPSECYRIDPNMIDLPDDWEIYKSSLSSAIKKVTYPWNQNNPLPGDMDDTFPTNGDYDGDGISNYDEYTLNCIAVYPTVPLQLHKGINLYYFPRLKKSFISKPQSYFYDPNNGTCEPKRTNPNNPHKVDCYYYNKDLKKWYESECDERVNSNTFNAIYNSEEGGILYLDLERSEHPILCLKSFWDPNSSQKHIENLNINEVWSKFVQVKKNTDPNQGILFQWDFSEFYPPCPILSLYSEDNDGIRTPLVMDMFQTSWYQIKPEGDLCDWSMSKLTYIIEWNKEYSIELDLPKGWSMISIPVKSSSMFVSDLFPEAKVVYGYKKESGYVRFSGGENLDAGKGYWVLSEDAQDFVLNGDPVCEYSFQIFESGWDMIGGCSFLTKASADGCTIDVIYEYIPGFGYQRVLNTEFLRPSVGYWILNNNVLDLCEIKVGTEK